jgi:phospholipid transport system substrate-binding protein
MAPVGGAMPGRREFLTACVALALAVSGFSARADEFAAGAQRFIESLADRAIAALTVPDLPRPRRVARFRTLFNDHFAVQAIAQWVLGRYWRQATAAEQAEFLALFEDLMVATYVDHFARYSGMHLSVTKTVAKGTGDAIVYSQINGDGENPLPVDWRVRVDWRARTGAGQYKITDVMVKGVSISQTQRSEFASVIRENGGKFEGLLAELRKRVKKARRHA